mgnify:CR=1 FL=1
MAQAKACSPTCPSFKCAQNSAFYRRDGVQCKWTEEMCNVAICQYSLCMKRRLLPNAICGETVKRQTVERDFEDDIDEPVKLKGKALRKFGDKEIY